MLEVFPSVFQRIRSPIIASLLKSCFLARTDEESGLRPFLGIAVSFHLAASSKNLPSPDDWRSPFHPGSQDLTLIILDFVTSLSGATEIQRMWPEATMSLGNVIPSPLEMPVQRMAMSAQ